MVSIDSQNRRTLSKLRDISLCLCIIIATLAAYSPSLKNGFVWDDDSLIANNKFVQASDGLKTIWFKPGSFWQYYPLTLTSFWIEYHFWKLNPFGYHLVNLILHCLNAILLFYILKRLSVPGAFMIAAVFSLHPVHVESVAWIAELKNVLSGMFFFLSLLCYLLFSFNNNPPEVPGKKKAVFDLNVFYVFAMGLYLCALLSKPITCSLPAVILLLLWWKRGSIKWIDIKPLIPMFFIGAIFGINMAFMEKKYVGAEGHKWALPFIDRFLIAGRALWFYAGKIIFPYKLSFVYPRWEIDSTSWWQYLFPLTALVFIGTLYFLHRRIGRGPITAVLVFSGILFPALGFFNVYFFQYSYVADHFQYLASIGLIALIFSGLTYLVNKYANNSKKIFLLFFIVLSSLLALQTRKQTYIYNNLETLYKDIIAKNPNCWMAHYNLGTTLIRSHTEEAIDHFVQAIRIKPDFEDAHVNLAVILNDRGHTEEAIEHFAQAIRIKPDSYEAHFGLAIALVKQGRAEEAIEHFTQAIQIKPDGYEAYNNLGSLYYHEKNIEQAINNYKQARRINPDSYEANYNLGVALYSKGDIDGAIDCFKTAIRIKPGGNAEKILKSMVVSPKN